MKTKIMILGATGMLGSMVYSFLKAQPKFEVIGSARKNRGGFVYFDINEADEKLETALKGYDYVINCIGITKPYCHDDNQSEIRNAIVVNSLFPYRLNALAQYNNFKVIQIATDCVFSGRIGKYKEDSPHDPLDVYGKTKSLGEVKSDAYLNIRSSIVGPEKYNKVFLLEWFLKQLKGATLKGFSNHFWNGVTTLQFAKLCLAIIKDHKFRFLNDISSVHHFVPNETVTKHRLLCIFNEVFNKELIITEQKSTDEVIDRTLGTKYNSLNIIFPPSDLRSELKELKFYMETQYFNK
jgi:dTDP-4-dehydrorhamnose reductase